MKNLSLRLPSPFTIMLSVFFAAMSMPFSIAKDSPPASEPIASPSDDPGPLPPGDRVPPPHAAPTTVVPKGLPSALTSVPGTWTAQGPGPISGGQVEGITNGHVCGAIHTVITHPTNADIVYIGAANGGVWKTTNATATAPTWATTTDAMGSLSIGALAFDPLDVTSNTVWAGIGKYSSFNRLGGSRSGLLKTTDGGATWSAVDGGGTLVGKNISGIVVRGNTIVVSVNVADSFTFGNIGIWRSTDGGASFAQMSVGNGGGPTGLPGGVAYDIVSSTSAPNTVFTSLIFADLVGGVNGIFKSTDLGATWTRVSTPTVQAYLTGSTSNVEMSVGNSNNLFVSILETGTPVAIYSTPDGGANWSRMDIPTMPVSTAVTRTVTNATNATPIVITTSAAHGYASNNYVEIASVTGNTAANGIHQITVLSATTFSLDFSAGNGAYVSGGTARIVTSPNPRGVKGPEEGAPDEIAGGQGAIHFSILADPSNPALVYIGGDRQDTPFTNFIGANNFSGQLWRGDTGIAPNGLSPSSQWKHLTHSNAIAAIPGGGTSNNSSPHADSREMAMDVNGSLIEVDDGGIFRRSNPQNNTGAWTSMAGNLQVTEAHSIAYDTVSDIIITGNQDNGTSVQNSTGGTAYTAVSTADGGDVAVSVNPANAAQSIRYSSFQNLGSFRKRVMSNTNTLVSQSFPTLTLLGGAPAIVPQFTTPVVINTVNANRLIIGAANGIYESADQGTSVSRISALSPNDALSGGHTMIYGGRKNSVDNAEVLYAADGSTVLRRVAAAVAPVAVAGYSGGTARGIITDSEDYDHLFAIDNDQIFRSTDGGATFTDITGDIPAAAKDFRSLEFIRSGTEWAVVVGTLRGVYAARGTAPTDWGLVGGNMPNVYVWDMDYDAADNILVVSTLGRGVWRFSNARDIAQQPEIAVEEPVGNGLVDGISTVAYGNVNNGGSSAKLFTIRNTGSAPLTVSSVVVTGGNSGNFSVNIAGMSGTLAAAGSTTFTVAFNPNAVSSFTTTLQITSDDDNETVFDITLSGSGIAQLNNPVSSAGGQDVVTGGNAPDGTGADSGLDFDMLTRGGFIAENGHLAFPGELTGPGVDGTNFKGFWKHNGTLLSRLARTGDNAPETGATAAKFSDLPLIPGINDAGQVTLLASLASNPSSTPPTTTDNDTGLWSELGGTGFQILMREGDDIPAQVPPLPAGTKLGAFGSGCFATADTGAGTAQAAFTAKFKGGSTDSALLRASILNDTVTAVDVVARENDAAPGVAGQSFSTLNSTYTGAVRMDAQGNIVFGAALKPSNKSSIWYQPVAGGDPTAAVVSGNAAPGTSSATFAAVDVPVMGGGGTFAFRGVLTPNTGDNTGNAKNDGIWRGTATGPFTNILRRGDSNTNRPGLFTGAILTANPNIKAGNIWSGWLTNSNHGAWLGWVDLAGNGISAYPADTFGIYTDLSGTMTLLTASGQPAPNIAGASFFFIDHPVVSGTAPTEHLAFVATVTGGGTTAANNKGIWRSLNGAAPTLVLRTGDSMTVTPGGAKTIDTLDLPGSGDASHTWETPVMDANGRLLVYVTFTDGTTTQVIVP